MAMEHRLRPRRSGRTGSTGPSVLSGDSCGVTGPVRLRQEKGLARLELREMAAVLVRDSIDLVVAGTLEAPGDRALSATLIRVHGRNVFRGSRWPGAPVVGGVLLVGGGIWALAEARRRGQNLRPAAMLGGVRADVEWAERAAGFKREVM